MDLLFADDAVALHVMDVFPKYSLWIPVRPKYPQEVGGAPAAHGSAYLDSPRVPGRTKVVNRRMEFRRISVRITESGSSAKGRARAGGLLNAVMACRVDFIIARWRMAAHRGSRFPPGSHGVWTPSFRLAGTRLTGWSLALTQSIFLGGATEGRICFARRIPRFLSNLRSGGNSAWWRRRLL